MRDTSYQRVDEIKFFAFNIRNRGYMYMDNGIEKHILSGEYVRVYPVLVSPIFTQFDSCFGLFDIAG
jgi:hypothetical protein